MQAKASDLYSFTRGLQVQIPPRPIFFFVLFSPIKYQKPILHVAQNITAHSEQFPIFCSSYVISTHCGLAHLLNLSCSISRWAIKVLSKSQFLYRSDFPWYQFWGFLKCKISHFTTFRGSEFWVLWIFALFAGWNLPNLQNLSFWYGKNSSF